MVKQTAKKTEKSDCDREEEAKRAAGKKPRIVTKDTNTASGFIVDPSVFDDLPETSVKSSTIDENMLAAREKGRRKKTLDLSLAERIESNISGGLSSEQVIKRVEEGYVNETQKKSAKTYGGIFVSNICTFFNLLTFIVAIALIAVGAGGSQLFFMVIILANITIGIVQEIRSKRTVDKLNLLTAPSALVVRDGEKKAVPVNELVLDDIMYLEMGKQICSDAVVVSGDVEVNEAMLTGESVPVRKTAGSMLYSGSFVSSGTCYARVEKVGSANYVETLTSYAKKYRKPKSELHNSIRLIIKAVSCLIVPLTIIMLWANYKSLGGDWYQIIPSVAGSVIGMIPAGMFLLTSVALAVSVIRLAKKKTLVQDLYCIEMLARVDVLCLDKTGTITDGTMQVNNVIEIKGLDQSEYTVSDVIGSMLTATGDNNQTALALANYFGYSSKLKATRALPFSSQRKLSAVTFDGAGTYMLGAPEFVLKDMGVRIEKIINENAANGFRVMVLAHSPAEMQGEKLPAVRRPLCLIVIEDHIREDAIETIRWFKENNVSVKVISGDNPLTVSEVASRVGVENAELYISLEGLSNQEVIEAAAKYTVFGRVTPEQKSVLVKALKAKGHTVAMTGDGVNDILAMRESDCAVAIASGSEAARNVAHLVLLDSNFTSMPDVVMEGRRVVNNIQKSSSLFLMKTFMSIVLTIIFLILSFTSGAVYPFKTSNLLLIEFFVIGIPSFALALQSNKNIIRGRFIANVISRCVPGGIALVLSVMSVYLYQQFIVVTLSPAQSLCMMVLAMTFTGMMVLFKICEPFDAYRSVLMIFICLMCVLAVVVMPPDMFGIVPLDAMNFFFLMNVVFLSYFIVTILMKIMSHIKIFDMSTGAKTGNAPREALKKE